MTQGISEWIPGDLPDCQIPHGELSLKATCACLSLFYADEALIAGMEDKVFDQSVNVASLPGIVACCYSMPDAHWGYGFPIGGVAAFDAEQQGIVSAGGVDFDISYAVRTLPTGLRREECSRATIH